MFTYQDERGLACGDPTLGSDGIPFSSVWPMASRVRSQCNRGVSKDETHTLWLEHHVEQLRDHLRVVERQRNLLGIYLLILALAVLVLSPNPLISLGGLALLALSAYVGADWK